MKRTIFFAAIASLVLTALPAQAHHSPAAFDMEHPVTAIGTVKEFRWGNPHTWLYLMVPNGKGGADEWEIEGPALVTLTHQGWKSTSLKPGDKVQVLMARRRDGGHGGSFMRLTRENGEVLETGRL